MSKLAHIIKIVTMSAVLAIAFIIGITVINVKDAHAGGPFNYFDRINIDKCVIDLDREYYDWTGRPVCPQVKVYYNGKELRKSVDYTLEYSNNIDAGEGKLKVKGIGDYRGSKTVKYTIYGVDLKRECSIDYRHGKIDVYVGGRLLHPNDYELTVRRYRERLVKREKSNEPDKDKCTYYIEERVTVKGKGQYFGEYIGYVEYTEVRFEKSTGEEYNAPGYNPGPGHGEEPGYPGHHPEPGDNHGGHPGGPGDNHGGHPGGPGDNHGGHPGGPGNNHGGHPGGPGDNHGGHPGGPGDNHGGHPGGPGDNHGGHSEEQGNIIG